MPQPFPQFSELKAFITAHPGATICEIRDHFKQGGDSIIKNQKKVIAYSIDPDFYTYLATFIREKFVKVELNALACFLSDRTRYIGPGKFMPITLSISC